MDNLEEHIKAYRVAVLTAQVCARALKRHDIPKLLRDIERADSLGPFADPSLWIAKRQQMMEDKSVLQAALELWKIGERLEELDAKAKAKADER